MAYRFKNITMSLFCLSFAKKLFTIDLLVVILSGRKIGMNVVDEDGLQ